MVGWGIVFRLTLIPIFLSWGNCIVSVLVSPTGLLVNSIWLDSAIFRLGNSTFSVVNAERDFRINSIFVGGEPAIACKGKTAIAMTEKIIARLKLGKRVINWSGFIDYFLHERDHINYLNLFRDK
jgi:hypothetical protein